MYYSKLLNCRRMCSNLLFHNVLKRAVCKCMECLAYVHTCPPSFDRKPLSLLSLTLSPVFHHLYKAGPAPAAQNQLQNSSKPFENQLKTSSKHCAGLRPTDIVMDLFCGTGSIGLTLAKDCHHVYGFESAASSVADARRNAEVNGINNATFVHGDLTKVAAMMGKQYSNPDVIVTGGLFLRKIVNNLSTRRCVCHRRGCS